MSNKRKLRQNALIALGTLTGIVAVVRTYNFFVDDGQLLGIASMLVLSLSSFYWARHYAKLSAGDFALPVLISREGDKIVFKSKPQGGYKLEQGVELEVARLSVFSIREDYLSVIVDGNGNGYDFFVDGSGNEIEQYLRSILSSDEFENITFKHV